MRRILKFRKIGHAGTLDSFADGVLPLALGEATKTIPYVMKARKAYSAKLLWGQKTDTADITGSVVATASCAPPSLETLRQACQSFVGGYDQVPPQYSAIKIQGKRASDRVRAGEVIVIKPRFVDIFSIHIHEHNPTQGYTWLEVSCGAGTYIRALAEDIAARCGHLACLETLTRTQVGKFLIADAISLENLEKLGHKVDATKAWLPISAALDDIPAIRLDADAIRDIRFGRCVQARNCGDVSHCDGTVLCLDEVNEAVAIAQVRDGQVYPQRVLHQNRKD